MPTTARRSCRRWTPRSRPRSGPSGRCARSSCPPTTGRWTSRWSTPTWRRWRAWCGRTPRASWTWCTPRCTGWALRSSGRCSPRPASTRRARSASRPSPTRTSPTVSFPNPEEPGAMDLALALAGRAQADLIIANDPDADRCAVGVRVPGGRRPPGRLADAARRRGGRAAGGLAAAPRHPRDVRDHHRLLDDALGDGGQARGGLRRDAHRVQVDLPGRAGPGLRL